VPVARYFRLMGARTGVRAGTAGRLALGWLGGALAAVLLTPMGPAGAGAAVRRGAEIVAPTVNTAADRLPPVWHPAAGAQFIDLSLSAGRLNWFETVGKTGSLWRRPVTPRAGAENATLGHSKRLFSDGPLSTRNPMLYSRAPISASAGRELVPPLTQSGVDHLSYQLLDRGVLQQTFKIKIWEGLGVRQSGPYSVVGRRVYRADGALMLNLDSDPAPRLDVFGPLVIYSTDDGRVRLRDLSRPKTSKNPLLLADAHCSANCFAPVAIWGNTVAWARPDGLVAVRSLSSKKLRLVYTGSMLGLRLGDGVMSWNNSIYDDDISVLNLNSAHSHPQALRLRAAEVDDHLVAGLNLNLTMVVSRLPFSQTVKHRPRLIGVLAPATFEAGSESWDPQIDVTKPVNRARLALSRSGTVVRTLAGTAPDGSIRDLSWDGKTSTGAPAPAGVYTWKLTARANDGQGTLVAADGSSAATGTVTLVR
jgi:hypothetical protein